MVDAGPELGAVLYSEFSRAEVAHEGRPGLVTGWAYDVRPELVPDSWSDRRWQGGARQRWRTQEHNNSIEGRCVVMPVSLRIVTLSFLFQRLPSFKDCHTSRNSILQRFPSFKEFHPSKISILQRLLSFKDFYPS